jgi:hypothetical protein
MAVSCEILPPPNPPEACRIAKHGVFIRINPASTPHHIKTKHLVRLGPIHG